MPVVPSMSKLNAASVDILNAIRNSASTNYKDYVPVAVDADSVRTIGAVIMLYPALQNEFLNALVNRIGKVIIESKTYENPWAIFKRGTLEMGETIEDVFVNIARPFQFDPATAATNVFARQIPDVRAAFHVVNWQKFYKQTVSREQLQHAFLAIEGVTDLISQIIKAMYTGLNYDEFLTMKYLIARNILNGQLTPITVPTVTTANMKPIVSTIKATSNAMEFLGTNYNLAGVSNSSTKDEQYIITTAEFDAVMDVEVLAAAFNMDKADFMGHRIMVDSFGELDTERLAKLFENDSTYTPLTSAQITALKAIPAVLVDKQWFVIFDNLLQMEEQHNSEGLYWNYFLHAWKTFSASPFANAAVFVPGTPSITSVTVAPSAVTVTAGQSVTFTATVATANFAPQSVTWSAQYPNDVIIDAHGVVTVKSTASHASNKITATSTYDSTKSAYGTITVSGVSNN